MIELPMRCYGHILNLQGPVSKLWKIIKYIRSSPQRSESFKILAQETDNQDDWLLHEESTAELQFTLSNDTRWNSTYLMIDRAIKQKNHIQSFLDWRLLAELKAKGSFGYLWEVLSGMEFLLEKLEDWKLFFDEPGDDAISQSQVHLPCRALRNGRIRGNQSTRVRSPELNTQALPLHSPLFAAAVILHPGRSLRWLETRWNTGDQLAWL
ncbi:hypothetical protein B0T09DRAFT_364552 [Sordaria sp. MPI-SDFR-AT-0083]|nr:hypothetical protein B0T09DRAFT_364552 [Sordaria sp. MPI-SDFR-AT-0083]